MEANRRLDEHDGDVDTREALRDGGSIHEAGDRSDALREGIHMGRIRTLEAGAYSLLACHRRDQGVVPLMTPELACF